MDEGLAEALKAGDLEACLAQARAAARARPAASAPRVALFEIHVILGDWQRALRQLEIASDLEPKLAMFVLAQKPLLGCESVRATVFEGRQTPLCLDQPPPWLPLLFEALRLDGLGEHGHAKDLRDQAFGQAPATSGRIDGEEFAWIADGDERFGPVLEAFVDGRYFWLPYDRVEHITLDGPQDLRDLAWLPAEFAWVDGGKASGAVPVRYPGSEQHADSRLRLARRTEWAQYPAGSSHGLGQRMLATDRSDHPLLDCRRIELDAGAMADGAGDG